MKNRYIMLLISLLAFSACEVYESPDRRTEPLPETMLYVEQYDKIQDNGQYWHPEFTAVPKRYVNCAYITNQSGNNNLGVTDNNQGLQAHLLAQSAAGIVNRALKNGTSEYGIWFRDESNMNTYKYSEQQLKAYGAENWSTCVPNQVASAYGEIREHISGYVLTDVERNPESAIVASVASHVYNAVIVDKRDEASYTGIYTKLYDASNKTTADAWREFKDKCNNKALVVMPVQTGQLREFSITNNLFVINLNKAYGTPSKGQNTDIFKEILAWLEPNSPVYGWEQGVGEDQFVGLVTKYGHKMVPYDWAYNTSFTSIKYKERQKPVLAQVTNPQFINYESDKKKFVSFYLSDGDNVQWMITNFETENFFLHPQASETKIAFGMPVANLAMIAPAQFDNLMGQQKAENTIIESLGGGYYYVDTFGELGNRDKVLKEAAKDIASHMRQHRVKVLGLVAENVASDKAKEAYQAYISANDQLEGIVVIQYSPYAGGGGEMYWFPNSNGVDIPVITVKYSLWNFGTYNNQREGTPTYIAHKINAEDGNSPFSIVSVHAWSNFTDAGASEDELSENASGGRVVGAGAAALCAKKLSKDTEVVSTQELIWRARMHYRPEQTKEILSRVF